MELRDAIVDVPEGVAGTLADHAVFDVLLQLDPSIIAQGTLREIAPEADQATRTRRIKIGLLNPPPAFRIGTTVTVWPVRSAKILNCSCMNSMSAPTAPDTNLISAAPANETLASSAAVASPARPFV